jgi:large conductance mechanosensitive channel
MLKGFKEFIMRGNLVELAVAFIIGGAFATVVTSFSAVILGLVGLLTGGKEFEFDNFEPYGIPVGEFLTALVAFLLLALVVYFFVVTPYNKLQERRAKGEEPTPPSEEVTLLTEIRDLLADSQATPSRTRDETSSLRG